MSNTIRHLTLNPVDSARQLALCGPLDENLKLIQQRLGIEISYRAHEFTLSGRETDVKNACDILQQLYRETEANPVIDPATVHLFVGEAELASQISAGPIIKTPKMHIKPRGANQQRYVEAIRRHDINFGVGPAGTGKTWLAVACAVQAFNEDQVKRILLVRPAVEAGEKLGFLPGDLAQKVDPYLRPLYDALYEMLGFEQVARLLEKGLIEIAPLAFMRGRTLNHSFIILDESQNTSPEQMKMFLTRIGFGSTAVITGDVTQVDLPRGAPSGLKHALNVLKDVKGISSTHFLSKDVVRHPLVQRIVDAYEDFEKRP
ncbi:MAG: PhoH family protein [Hahellaceae bacterium]|nr:PhoH family protein [Hahellaceae bacterium]